MKKKKETQEINSLLTEIKELKNRIKELEEAAAPKAAPEDSTPLSASAPKNTYSSDFLQIIIDSIPAPLFFKNAKGVYELCNSAFEDYHGLSRDEIIGKTVYDVAPHELAENYNNMDHELLENGGVQIYESRVRFCDRSLREVIFNKTCVYGQDGKVIGFIGVMLDISERKKAEAELLKSEELYRALAESSSDMIYVVDYDGKILFVNGSAAANLGINARDTAGKYQQDFFKEDIAKRQLSIIQNIYKTGTPYRSYEQKTYFGSREAWIDALLTPIKNGNGEVISVLGVSRDISERKKMQEDILKTSKLESLGILAGGIAHDFNNALMAIIGNIILARNRAGDNKKLQEILSRAEAVTCKAKNLTKQFITFSGGGAPIKAPCHDLYSLIKELARFVLSGSETVYTVEKNGEIPAVNIDEGQISHALTNIIINARQAVKNAGKIKIDLSCETATDNSVADLCGGRYVKISIADSGHGVPKEIQHKIFDPYFTTKSEGSGLGLSASYSIIKSHGGLIDFSTNEKEGSVFNVYIPANGVAAEKASPAKRGVRRKDNKEKILIMDDDESVLAPLCEILTELGYSVRTAANFEQAVYIFNAEFSAGSGFDAAILDLVIKGGIDGVETLNELKKIDPLIKAIISSGYTHGPVISNFVDYGFDAVLTKPYQKADILNALAGLFGEDR
jgi:PAS domain S-box-containing protein